MQGLPAPEMPSLNEYIRTGISLNTYCAMAFQVSRPKAEMWLRSVFAQNAQGPGSPAVQKEKGQEQMATLSAPLPFNSDLSQGCTWWAPDEAITKSQFCSSVAAGTWAVWVVSGSYTSEGYEHFPRRRDVLLRGQSLYRAPQGQGEHSRDNAPCWTLATFCWMASI